MVQKGAAREVILISGRPSRLGHVSEQTTFAAPTDSDLSNRLTVC
jgi:hypothetical protein